MSILKMITKTDTKRSNMGCASPLLPASARFCPLLPAWLWGLGKFGMWTRRRQKHYGGEMRSAEFKTGISASAVGTYA